MNTFSYSRATDVATAVAQIDGDPRAKFLGGGTNLVDLMKYGVEKPDRLIDIARLPLDKIEELPDGGLRIGALARNSDMAANTLIQERYPVLSEALLAGASPQLRNSATAGGNLLQRTRCPYFMDVAFTKCNKRVPGSGCAALEGYNRTHAILGASHSCIATHPSDMAVAMAALEATVRIQGPKGTRTIRLADFHRLPGNTPNVETELQHGELILGIDLPRSQGVKTSHYLKVRDRSSYSFALVSVAVVLEMEGNRIQSARIALGGVAHKPWRVLHAEQSLAGKEPGKTVYRAAAEITIAGAKPYAHNSFKVELAKRCIVRALETAAAKA
jgi:xanthine dehydrogenase YagS FAD-binding subunit